jgi:cell division protein FtsL
VGKVAKKSHEKVIIQNFWWTITKVEKAFSSTFLLVTSFGWILLQLFQQI